MGPSGRRAALRDGNAVSPGSCRARTPLGEPTRGRNGQDSPPPRAGALAGAAAASVVAAGRRRQVRRNLSAGGCRPTTLLVTGCGSPFERTSEQRVPRPPHSKYDPKNQNRKLNKCRYALPEVPLNFNRVLSLKEVVYRREGIDFYNLESGISQKTYPGVKYATQRAMASRGGLTVISETNRTATVMLRRFSDQHYTNTATF